MLEIADELLYRQISDGSIREVPLQPFQVAADPHELRD